MATLDQLKTGQLARIVDVQGEDSMAVRLMEMGLIEGEDVEMIGRAPLGDPIEFSIRGYRLSLREREAQRISVAVLE